MGLHVGNDNDDQYFHGDVLGGYVDETVMARLIVFMSGIAVMQAFILVGIYVVLMPVILELRDYLKIMNKKKPRAPVPFPVEQEVTVTPLEKPEMSVDEDSLVVRDLAQNPPRIMVKGLREALGNQEK